MLIAIKFQSISPSENTPWNIFSEVKFIIITRVFYAWIMKSNLFFSECDKPNRMALNAESTDFSPVLFALIAILYPSMYYRQACDWRINLCRMILSIIRIHLNLNFGISHHLFQLLMVKATCSIFISVLFHE